MRRFLHSPETLLLPKRQARTATEPTEKISIPFFLRHEPNLDLHPCAPSSSSSSSSSSSGSSTKVWIIHGVVVGAAIVAAIGARGYLLGRSRSRVVGIIPARFASSLFQGKALVNILEKPMIQRTWERAKLATTLDQVNMSFCLVTKFAGTA